MSRFFGDFWRIRTIDLNSHLQHTTIQKHQNSRCSTVQHTAIRLQHNAPQDFFQILTCEMSSPLQHIVKQQHTRSHCNTLQHIKFALRHTTKRKYSHCNTRLFFANSYLRHELSRCNKLQQNNMQIHTAPHCTTQKFALQHTATHENNCEFLLAT